jgi:uncharacterized membrane protein
MSDQRTNDAHVIVGAQEGRAGTEPIDGRPDDRVGLARRVIASYPDYRGAERAVQRLSEAEFPVEQTAIVGSGLTLVEKVTGRVSAATVAARSAASGAVVGALLGWLLGLFDLMDPLVAALWLALYGALLGAVIGVAVGLLAYAATRGRRGFTTIGGVRAERYDITVDAESADRAVRVLRETSPS